MTKERILDKTKVNIKFTYHTIVSWQYFLFIQRWKMIVVYLPSPTPKKTHFNIL